MPQERETELKLEVDQPDQLAISKALGLGEPRATRLSATYYDTPKAALGRAGISFRLRRSPDGCIQTINLARSDAAGLFDRDEWERTLAGDAPDLSAVDDAGLGEALGDTAAWQKIRPAFVVEVERRVWRTVTGDGDGDIEIVFDEGEVSADGQHDRLCEIELELKQAPADALFGLARSLAEAVPVRIGVLTKAERGYRLLSGEAGKATPAGAMQLTADATIADAFAVVVEACLHHFRLNEPLVAERDAAALHQARVALRRLRSALSLFRDVVADPSFDALREGLKRVANVLSEARNLDVLIERIAEAGNSAAPLDALRREREAAYAHAVEELASERTRRLMIDVLEWSVIGHWCQGSLSRAVHPMGPIADFAAQVLDRQRRRVKKRGRGLIGLDAEPRHEVRIEAKKLRYAAEFFGSLFQEEKQRRRRKSFVTALEAVQEHLGALNDLATAEELAHGLAARGIDLPQRRVDEGELLRQADAAYDRLVDAKPFWR